MDGGKLRPACDKMVGEIAREPQHNRLMRMAGVDLLSRAPGMRQVGTEEDKVLMAVRTDVVADVALSQAVQRHGQLKFGMVVPFKRKGLEAAMEHCPGAALINQDFFEEGLHSRRPQL